MDEIVNIVQLGKPSQTALRVAVLRAAHQLLDDPIVFEDARALQILGAELEAQTRADPFVHNEPIWRGLRATVVARSRVAEDTLRRSVLNGTRQYVVLGAGLDTFAYRNPYAGQGLRVFEVDHPSTQVWKRDQLHAVGIAEPESLSFVGVDFESESVFDRLSACGFDANAPACIAWLGVTVYLNAEIVYEMLGVLARLAKGSRVVFDYRADPSLLSPSERVGGEYLAALVAQRGEPWRSVFVPDSLEHRLFDFGFSDVEHFTPDTLNQTYFAHRKDGLRVGTSSRIVCARV